MSSLHAGPISPPSRRAHCRFWSFSLPARSAHPR